MQRVAVVGPGGAGKTTFAADLGRLLGLPVVHLDRHFWKPGWVPTPEEDWRALQAELLAGEQWVVDGNYGGTFDVRFGRADTVIVLAPRPSSCLAGAISRTATNRGRAVQAPGCPERVDFAFLRWIWRYPRDSRPRLDAELARHPQLEVVELRSRGSASRYLAALAGERS